MKRFYFLAMMLAAGIMTLTLTACGDDDNKDNDGGGSYYEDTSTSSGITGWYIRHDMAGFWLYLYSDDYTYSFNMEGEIMGVSSSYGTVQNFSNGEVQEVYYIPDDQTFVKYSTCLYRENAPAASGKTLLYRFNYPNLGTLGLYAVSTTYYTYWREGNKLYTTDDGWTVYTITPTGIVADGSSFVYSKYDPNKVY